MAEEARRAWAQLKAVRGGRVWMRHVPRRDPSYLLYMQAGGLAQAGKSGTHTYSETVS